MKAHQRILLLGSIGLLITAIILLTSSQLLQQPAPAKYTNGLATATWQTLPTRRPLATATLPPNTFYELIQTAILSHDYQTAKLTIDTAKTTYPDDPYITQSEARLALVQKNYDLANDLIWESIGKDPTNAENWALAGTIFTFNDEPELSSQAFITALQLNPDLAPHLFQERWNMAIQDGDSRKITELADEYYLMNPTDPLADYYNAQALLISGHINVAITVLVEQISSEVQTPAAIWYILGRVYLERQSFWESVRALEYAKFLNDQGDTSMRIVAQESDSVLEQNLATAYLRNSMCIQAETLFRQLAEESQDESYSDLISEAVTCQTPTPTPTHWMLSLQSTATPSPN